MDNYAADLQLLGYGIGSGGGGSSAAGRGTDGGYLAAAGPRMNTVVSQ
jgi:hypothetical protein